LAQNSVSHFLFFLPPLVPLSVSGHLFLSTASPYPHYLLTHFPRTPSVIRTGWFDNLLDWVGTCSLPLNLSRESLAAHIPPARLSPTMLLWSPAYQPYANLVGIDLVISFRFWCQSHIIGLHFSSNLRGTVQRDFNVVLWHMWIDHYCCKHISEAPTILDQRP
jgi:hypothetical protein